MNKSNREIAEEFKREEMEFQDKAQDNLMLGICEICEKLFEMKYFMDHLCEECDKRIGVF